MFRVEGMKILEENRVVRESLSNRTRKLALFGWLTLIGATGACVTGTIHGNYASAEEAVADKDWPLAVDLWYEIHESENPKSERSYVETARALYKNGDAESACSLLHQGRFDYPESSEIVRTLGRIQESQGFRRAAEQNFEAWAELEPDNPWAHIALGRMRLCLGWEHGAKEPLLRALEMDHENHAVHALLAKLHRACGDDDMAFRHFTLAVDFGAKDPYLLLDASLTAMELGPTEADPEIALAWAITVSEQQPQNTCAHFLRGVHLQALDRKQEAIGAFARAVETDPGCLEGLTRLAKLYSEAGQVDRILDLVTRALEIEDDPDNRERLLILMKPQ
ncbi:MAG: tetratricopeptide (TPR) repeat protein [Candidatus Paceibacteria bacterium]|jgi:tetratricopeptide (TPR) repeat protein